MLREQNVVYYPEDLSLLGNVFDQAIASVPAATLTPSIRNMVAKRILTEAAAGERDPVKLGKAALMDVTIAAGSSGFDAPDPGRRHTVLSQEPHADRLLLPQTVRRAVATRMRHW